MIFYFIYDCSIFALNTEQTLVCTELFDEEELQMIEKESSVLG